MENENYELEALNTDVDLDEITSESSDNSLLVGGIGLALGIAGTLFVEKGFKKFKAWRSKKKTEETDVIDADDVDEENTIDVESEDVDEENNKKSNKKK